MNYTDKSLEELYNEDIIACRHYKCLTRAGYKTLGELAELSPEEIYSIKNIGRKGIYPILVLLKEYGLKDFIN